jgi:hypothetical protein
MLLDGCATTSNFFCLRADKVIILFGEASPLTSTLDSGVGCEVLLADYAGALWKFLFARGWKFLGFHTSCFVAYPIDWI